MNKDVSKLNIKSALFLIKSDVSLEFLQNPIYNKLQKDNKKNWHLGSRGSKGSIGSIRQYKGTNIHD